VHDGGSDKPKQATQGYIISLVLQYSSIQENESEKKITHKKKSETNTTTTA
jgi:hypothetical protein